MSKPGSNLDFALQYATMGWKVLSLKPNSKAPHGRLAPQGFKCATSDPAVVREWWQAEPLAGVGAVLGPNMFALDVDNKGSKRGSDTLAVLVSKHGGVSTLTSATINDGLHLIYSCPAPIGREGVEVLGEGLDVKSNTGYVVLPPTRIDDKAYEWVNWAPGDGAPAIAQAPDWMLAALANTQKPGQAGAQASEPLDDEDFDPADWGDEVDEINARTISEMREALGHVASDDRDLWIKVGNSLACLKGSEFEHEAEQLWLDWSAKSEKFDHADAAYRWSNFKPSRTGHAAVFSIASEHGWINPRIGLAPGQKTATEVIELLRSCTQAEVLETWVARSKHLPPDAVAAVVEAVGQLTGQGPRPLNAALKLAQQRDRERSQAAALQSRAGDRAIIEYRAEDRTKMADELEALILAAAEPGTYVTFGGTLAEVATRQMPGTHMIDACDIEPPSVPTIVPLDEVAVIARAETVAVFVTGKGSKQNAIGVPQQVIEILLNRRNSAAPKVEGLITHPLVLPNGQVIDIDGLHESSGLFAQGASICDARPYSQDEATSAIERIRQVFLAGFEFASQLDADIALAGLFTAVQRRVLDSAPGLVIKAAMQASGKTTLARRIHVILTGRDMPVTTWPSDESEVQRRLLSSLIRSPAMLVFDNLSDGSTFESPSIALAMTSPTFTQRVLGSTKEIDVPTNSFFVLTGNGLALGSDEESRWLVTCLAPSAAKPAERTFQHADVVAHALGIRAQVLADVVGIIAGYLASGQSFASATRFQRWDRLVRQPLLWAGCQDIKATFTSNAAQSDKGLALGALLNNLQIVYPSREFTSSDVATAGTYGFDDFADEEGVEPPGAKIVESLRQLGVRDPTSPTAIGKILGANVGRVAPRYLPDGSEQGGIKLVDRICRGTKLYNLQYH